MAGLHLTPRIHGLLQQNLMQCETQRCYHTKLFSKANAPIPLQLLPMHMFPMQHAALQLRAVSQARLYRAFMLTLHRTAPRSRKHPAKPSTATRPIGKSYAKPAVHPCRALVQGKAALLTTELGVRAAKQSVLSASLPHCTPVGTARTGLSAGLHRSTAGSSAA